MRLSYFFKPACFSTLFTVLGGMSIPGLPATVTVPGLLGCRNWRWLPLVRTNIHPSDSIREIKSRTFTVKAYHPAQQPPNDLALSRRRPPNSHEAQPVARRSAP